MTKRSAFIIVDMQNDFISQEGSFAQMGFNINNLQKVIPRIFKFKESLKNLGNPTIYIISHYDDIYLTNSIKNRYKRNGYNIPLCISETQGAQIVDELEPVKGDIIIIKHRYDGFLGTNLEFILKSMNINILIFSGIEAHVCIQQTALHGYMLGYNIILVEDCLASINENDKKNALNYCKKYYGIVKSSKEILEKKNINFRRGY